MPDTTIPLPAAARLGALAVACGLFAAGAPAASVERLHVFDGAPTRQPSKPIGDLVPLAGRAGAFAGVTAHGGDREKPAGTLYATTLDGRVRLLHAFASPAEGRDFNGTPAQGPDGSLYGTSTRGGRHGAGTVWRLRPDGRFDVLHHLDADEGEWSTAGLAFGADGRLYGTTMYGGPHGAGGVFRMSTDGAFEAVHAFDGSVGTGADPAAALTLAADGSLWGTTASSERNAFNGSEGDGTVFRLTPDGRFSTLHVFIGATDGCSPQAALVEGEAGWFYGVAAQCGAAGQGTVFRVNAAGAFETLHAFAGGDRDGAQPRARLARGSDGLFYGSTSLGGAQAVGALFRLAADGSGFELLHDADCRLDRACHLESALVETTPARFIAADGGHFRHEGAGATYLLDAR